MATESPSPNGDLHFDFGRQERLGFPEIVYGESKSPQQLQELVFQCRQRQHPILITRCHPSQAEALSDGHYDPLGRTWTWPTPPPEPSPVRVAVVSGGTSDAPVVRECVNTLEFLSLGALPVQDIGVAAIHRLLGRLEEIQRCEVIICIAGFEGALPSVVAGQCPQPVIAVPTSIGYGVAAGGTAALHGMLSSCANGLMVMNIDNGVGAALAAKRILRNPVS